MQAMEQINLYEYNTAMSFFFYKQATEIECYESEVARYLGYANRTVPEEQIKNIIHECCKQMHGIITPKCV